MVMDPRDRAIFIYLGVLVSGIFCLMLIGTILVEGTKVVKIEDIERKSEWSNWEEFEATAYTHQDPGCNKLTKTEFRLCPGARIVAVDPNNIPLGSTVEIKGFGLFYAEDIGGAIRRKRIDIFYWNIDEALEFGRRNVTLRWKEK